MPQPTCLMPVKDTDGWYRECGERTTHAIYRTYRSSPDEYVADRCEPHAIAVLDVAPGRYRIQPIAERAQTRT